MTRRTSYIFRRLLEQVKATDLTSSVNKELFSNLVDYYAKSQRKQQQAASHTFSSRLIRRPSSAQENKHVSLTTKSKSSSLNASSERLESLPFEIQKIQVIDFDLGVSHFALNRSTVLTKI
jgi:hypothetical protein